MPRTFSDIGPVNARPATNTPGRVSALPLVCWYYNMNQMGSGFTLSGPYRTVRHRLRWLSPRTARALTDVRMTFLGEGHE